MVALSLLTMAGGLVGRETEVSQKMPWEDSFYAKDIPATQPDSRAEERAKGGWTEFIRHHEDRKRWVTASGQRQWSLCLPSCSENDQLIPVIR